MNIGDPVGPPFALEPSVIPVPGTPPDMPKDSILTKPPKAPKPKEGDPEYIDWKGMFDDPREW